MKTSPESLQTIKNIGPRLPALFKALGDLLADLDDIKALENTHAEATSRLSKAADEETEHKNTLAGIQTKIDTAQARLRSLELDASKTINDADTEAQRVVKEANETADRIVADGRKEAERLISAAASNVKGYSDIVKKHQETIYTLEGDIESKKTEHSKWQGKIDEAKDAVKKVLAPLNAGVS